MYERISIQCSTTANRDKIQQDQKVS